MNLIKIRKIFKLRDVNRKFPVSIYTGIIPEFRFTQQISGSFHFQNGNFFSGKMETLELSLCHKLSPYSFATQCRRSYFKLWVMIDQQILV